MTTKPAPVPTRLADLIAAATLSGRLEAIYLLFRALKPTLETETRQDALSAFRVVLLLLDELADQWWEESVDLRDTYADRSE